METDYGVNTGTGLHGCARFPCNVQNGIRIRIMLGTQKPCTSRRRRRVFCEHCKTKVTKTTFYRHRAKFFDKETNEWKRFPRAVVESSSSECDSVEIEVADDLHFRIVEGELP